MARNILNISLPDKTANSIRQKAKKGGYASVSEYVRYIIRDHEERERLMILQDGQTEFRAGKGKKLDALKDLR